MISLVENVLTRVTEQHTPSGKQIFRLAVQSQEMTPPMSEEIDLVYVSAVGICGGTRKSHDEVWRYHCSHHVSKPWNGKGCTLLV